MATAVVVFHQPRAASGSWDPRGKVEHLLQPELSKGVHVGVCVTGREREGGMSRCSQCGSANKIKMCESCISMSDLEEVEQLPCI